MKPIATVAVAGEALVQLKVALKLVPLLELEISEQLPAEALMLEDAMSDAPSRSDAPAVTVNEWPAVALANVGCRRIAGAELLAVAFAELFEAASDA